MSVLQEYRLFISNDAYTLIGDHQQTLTIDRATGQLGIKGEHAIFACSRG